MSQILDNDGEWTLLDEAGFTALTFTSFIDIDCRNTGQALAYPTELGGFANYNKVESPLEIKVTLALQGTNSDFEYALSKLGEYKRKAVTLAVSTPACLYGSMTLESYSYTRSRDNNAGMLTVELGLKEVRNVKTQVAARGITSPKNPTSADNVNVGRVRAESFPYGLQQ